MQEPEHSGLQMESPWKSVVAFIEQPGTGFLTNDAPILSPAKFDMPENPTYVWKSGRTRMRFHDTLDDLMSTKARMRCLRQLTRFPKKRFTGRELARLAGVSPTQAAEALDAFHQSGLVDRSTVGASGVWELKEDHVLVPDIRAMFDAESRLLGRLFNDVRSALRGIPVRSARLFGSVAGGTERPDSDIDLYVEVSTEAAKRKANDRLLDLWSQGARKYGNPVNFLVYTTRERGNPPNPGLIKSIFQEGRTIIGE